VIFEKEYIMRCWSAEWIARNGCALRWCHRGVGRWTEGTVGFREWTAQFCVWKTIGKDSCEACAIACQNCAVYSVFRSRMTSHSIIAQFIWQCIAPLTWHSGVFVQPLLLWKSNKCYMFWMCVFSIRYPSCNAHAPYCHVWPVWPAIFFLMS